MVGTRIPRRTSPGAEPITGASGIGGIEAGSQYRAVSRASHAGSIGCGTPATRRLRRALRATRLAEAGALRRRRRPQREVTRPHSGADTGARHAGLRGGTPAAQT